MPTIRKAVNQPKLNALSIDLGAVVQNTWYTVLEGPDIDILGLGVKVTVSDETVELKVTIDGTTFATSGGVAVAQAGNCFTGLPEYLRLSSGTPNFIQTAAAANFDAGNSSTQLAVRWCKGRSVKVEARKTTAAGAAHLIAYGIYYQY